MSLSWNNMLSIADARLTRLYGQRLAGAYGVRFNIEFNVFNWTQQGPFPVMMFLPSLVTVITPGSAGLILGKALPEVPLAFSVGEQCAGIRNLGFDLALSPAAMDAIEEARNGEGVSFSIAIQAEVRRGGEVGVAHELAPASFTVSDWLKVLGECSYGHSMLFEIPLPDSASSEAWTKLLSGARAHFLKGHYAQAVGDCRLVLEALTDALGQAQQLADALDQRKTAKHGLSLAQRELVLRQVVKDYCSPAHHTDGGVPADIYDRRSAQMMLATTATLVSAALSREAAATRPPTV